MDHIKLHYFREAMCVPKGFIELKEVLGQPQDV